MKSAGQRHIDLSVSRQQWATHPINEKKLNRAFQDGRKVFLVFSVQSSGHFQGVARMTSASGSEKGHAFGTVAGYTFSVEWIKRYDL